MKSVIYEELAQRLQDAGLAEDGCAGLVDPVDLIDAAYTIRALQSRLESLEKDAAQMHAALADIASGEVMRIHAFGPFATEQPEAATADDMMDRAASALFFIDTAMQANKGE